MFLSRLAHIIPLFSISIWAAVQPAQAASLAAHRAFYVLAPKQVDKSSGLLNIEGVMALEVKGNDCEGYAANFRVVNRFTRGEEGSVQEMDVRTTTFETGDSLALDVQQMRIVNGTSNKQSRVKLNRTSADQPGDGQVEGRDSVKFTLQAGALLPAQHQKHLIELAGKGETRDASVVFDGTDDDKPSRVISFIGAKKTGLKLDGVSGEGVQEELGELSYWPVTTSYYDMDAPGDAEPRYQASFNLLENGISTDLVMSYGSYVLTGKLQKLELLKAEPCN